MKTKRCSKCGETKAVGEFYKDRRRKGGLNSWCKKCVAASSAHWYKAHSEQARENSKRRYKAHSEQHRESAKRWYREHPEQARENSKRWYKAHSEQKREYAKRWAREHPEQARETEKRWREKHPEQKRESAKRWYREHPESTRQRGQRRRALKRSLPATLTVKQWQKILLKAGNCCTYCDRGFTDKLRPVQDHFIPLSKGGAYTKENIVPACGTCNSRKGAKVFKDIHEARKYLKGK